MNGKAELIRLLDEAYKTQFVQGGGLNHSEHTFLGIAKLLAESEDARDHFLHLARNEIARGGQVADGSEKRADDFLDTDIILFIAHLKRWPEFHEAVKARTQSESYRNKLSGERDIADLVSEALDDEWEDRDLYAIFRS